MAWVRLNIPIAIAIAITSSLHTQVGHHLPVHALANIKLLKLNPDPLTLHPKERMVLAAMNLETSWQI